MPKRSLGFLNFSGSAASSSNDDLSFLLRLFASNWLRPISQRSARSTLCRCFLITCWLGLPQPAHAQQVSGLPLLAPAVTASSGGKQIASIQLQGTAIFHAGSLADDGEITLAMQSSGQASMRFDGHGSGSRIESQDSIAPGMLCVWAGSDTVPHTVGAENCRRPLVWFLPALSLQQLATFPNVVIADLASGSVGSVPAHHLQIKWSSRNQNSVLERPRTIELGLDPVSSLPSALEYQLATDRPNSFQTVDVRFGDYRLVNGLNIPFSIQRYVNGSLQFDIHITNPSVQ
jgi:hypothetical protein